MKKITAGPFALVFRLILCWSVLACHKTSTTPPAPLVKATFAINLFYPDAADPLHEDKWELIVSEPGYILLDTVAPVNTTISATVRAYSNLVNLTTVVYHASSDSFSVTSFNGVDPSSWTTALSPLDYNYQIPVDTLPSVTDTIFYTHPPPLTVPYPSFYDGMYMSDYTFTGGFWYPVYTPQDSLYQPGGLLVMPYQHHGNNPAYLIFSQLGLCNFHTSATSHDTVDLTHMDTVVTLYYAAPPPYAMQLNNVYGYADTTNLDKSMQLWLSINHLPTEVEYPKTGVETYESFSLASSTSTNEQLFFYNYGTSVPSSLPFPTGQAYSITSNQADNFSLSFSSVSPSVYFTVWKAGKVTLVTVASPDSTVLHPATLLANLDSKLLQGQGFNGLVSVSFTWEQYAGMDYPTVVDYFGVPTNFKTKLIPAYTVYQKTF